MAGMRSTTFRAAQPWTRALAKRLRGAALVLFDGTLYTDEELIAQGLSTKTGTRMGHISMAGPDGSMAAFQALDVKRRIYVHMNNSNPACVRMARSAQLSTRAGWEVAHDGMEIWAVSAPCLMSPAELEAAIRQVGAERYHDKHPFHRLLHGGKLDKGQVQAWALNRYCYQAAMPRKDAALMSRVPTASCGASGCIASWIMTAPAARKAASSAGWC